LKGGASIQEHSKGLLFKAPKNFILNLDPRSSLAEIEVAKIVHLQKIADQTPDSFNNAPRITTSNVSISDLVKLAVVGTSIEKLIVSIIALRLRGCLSDRTRVCLPFG